MPDYYKCVGYESEDCSLTPNDILIDSIRERFELQILFMSFEDWVKDQEMQTGFFSCNSDVRIDFPFDNQNYTALWATHDCDQWDLFLTVVMDM